MAGHPGRVASPTPAYDPRQEAQTIMVTKAQAERMLSEEERALLALCVRGRDAYPVVELGGRWTWECGPLGAPTMYETKEAAVHNLELQLAVLREAERVEHERGYFPEGRALLEDPSSGAGRAIAEASDG